ncbi:heme/hemin ABC transporter substrate-binding protein [Pseudomonas sp. LRF_L74]|uniref:heme/hemin ABC transporter substrate-binding protein n=1 Tax=Pseudomonas sp. LRF_L74 TaxID=3369422 RepID=UPI003F64597E
MRFLKAISLGIALLAGQAAVADSLPQRWVSSGGSLSEWVVALGGEGRLVGVDTTSQHPQSLRKLPSVGYQRALSAEGVLALKPDILLGSEEMGPPPVLAQLKAAGVRIEILSAAPTLKALEGNLRRLGELLGEPDKARVALDGYQADLQRQAEWVSQAKKKGEAPRVLMLLGHAGSSPMAAGKDTLAAWMIEQAGGRNLTEHQGYKPLSSEAILALDPQVVLLSDRTQPGAGAVEAFLQQNPVIRQTAAGRDGRIVMLDPTLLVGGLGPRLPHSLAPLSTAFYPAEPPLAAERKQ